MKQLGVNFMNSFLLPYIQKQILGNIENDTRLQNMIRYDKVITPEEIRGLENDYFKNTGTLLETDEGLRKVFWKEFNDFVTRQKNLCNGNVLKLTFRLLPDGKTGSFSKEAEKNIEKFAFYAVNKLEDTLIERKIDRNKFTGKISSVQAEKDKSDLKKGKLILARNKDGEFDYMSNESVKRAIGNVKRTADIASSFFTGENNEVHILNPLDESNVSGLVGVQTALWTKQSINAEKRLEENGMYVEGHMTVDDNGISRGFAQDKNGIRLKVEFDVKKPSERIYRFTFVNNPNNKFFISENELRKRFGTEKKSALEVFREKEALAGRVAGIAHTKGTKLFGAGRKIILPADRKIKVVGITTKKSPNNEGEVPYVYMPNINSGNRNSTTNKTKTEIDRQRKTTGYKSSLEAKRALGLRNRNINKPSEIDTKMSVGGRKGNIRRGKLKASQRKNKKSFMVKVVKIYAASLGGALGLNGIISLLS